MPDNYSEILKARFCKQYIPRLKEFLEDFDISERIVNGHINTRDSLGMRFLLKKYEENRNKEQIQTLKENCFWHINNVNDEELYFAIEEFFYITYNKKEDKVKGHNSISAKRDLLLSNLFKLGIKVDEQSNQSDTTMFRIAEYFGVKGSVRDLGNLYQPLENLAKKVAAKCPEETGVLQFINALKLYSSVRNGVVHPDYKYKEGELNHYHEFIIFTYIGYVFVCRRIWKIISKLQIKQDLSPFKLDGFELPKNDIEITIDSGKHQLIKVSCNGNSLGKKENSYLVSISKYEPFTIRVDYDNNEYYEFKDELDCYSWFNNYKIVLPDEVSHTFRDCEGFSEGMKKLISSVTDSVKDCINGETKEAIRHEFAALQPLLNLSKEEGFLTNSSFQKSIQEILGELTSLSRKTGDVRNNIENVHLRIGCMHQQYLGKLVEFSDSLYDLKEKNIIIGEKVDTLLDFTKQHQKWVKYICSSILCVLGICLFLYCRFRNDGISWMQQPLISSVTFVLSVLLLISPFLICKKNIPYISKIKWPKLGYGVITKIATMVCFILVAGISTFFFTKNCRSSFLKEYDFTKYDTEKNQEVVKLMESILETNPEDDEEIRVQLIKYYIDFANDPQKGLLIASPMLDNIYKYSKGILALIEALYSQGKDYWKVKVLLNKYKYTENKDTNAINRIEGIMCLWGQGQTADVSKGNKLLRLAAKNGDVEAQYFLGYSLSHEMTDWEQTAMGSISVSEFNLIDAVEFLRMASTKKPKAALELGQLYADLNVKDSAEYYLQYALSHSKGELYKESLYRLGLFYKNTLKEDDYMGKAALMDYEPAILFLANKTGDHKASIELYSRPNGYQGYRYIMPIAFDYLALGQRNKALKTLQEGRPFGKFDNNFILGMEAMLGTSLLKRDSILGMDYMKASAEQGCLYAEMICIFREAEKTQITEKQLNRMVSIGDEIPFAFVLLSHLAHKEKAIMRLGLPFSDYYANQAVGRGNPAGNIYLVAPQYYHNFINKTLFLENEPKYAVYHSNIRERALRMKNDVHLNIVYGYQADVINSNNNPSFTDSAKSIHIRFWDDVSKANNVNLKEKEHHFTSHLVTSIPDSTLLKEFSYRIVDKQYSNPFN